jgi:hypothetical protein
MEAVQGIETDADHETALFAYSWPMKDYEEFIQRIAMIRG